MGFLSSLFGSSRPQPATQQTVTSQKLPSEIAPAVKKVVDEAELIYDAEKAAGYVPFEGATIAPFTAEEEAAQAGIAGLVGTQKPFLDEALGIIRQQSQVFTPEVAQQFMSPYQRAVTDIEKRESQRDFERNIQPALEAKAIQQGGGMSGLGTRAALEAAEAQRNQSRLLADIESRGLQSAFEDAQSAFEKQKAREANTASAIGKVGAETFKSGLAEQGALQTIGEQKRDLAQSALDEEYFKFLEEREFPQQKLAEYSGFVYGNPLTRLSNTTQSQTSNPFQPSFGQQLLGIGSTLGSSFLSTETGANRLANIFTAKGGGLSDLVKRKEGGRFPDMSGDGKVTQKDILMGRGVIARQVGGDLDVDEAEPTSLEGLRSLRPAEAELVERQQLGALQNEFAKFGVRSPEDIKRIEQERAQRRLDAVSQDDIPFAAQAASDFLAALGRAAVREEGNVGAAFAEETEKTKKKQAEARKLTKKQELANLESEFDAEDKAFAVPATLAAKKRAIMDSNLSRDKKILEMRKLIKETKTMGAKNVKKLDLLSGDDADEKIKSSKLFLEDILLEVKDKPKTSALISTLIKDKDAIRKLTIRALEIKSKTNKDYKDALKDSIAELIQRSK
jgi:hypothetical protein